jgi:AsmA protein
MSLTSRRIAAVLFAGLALVTGGTFIFSPFFLSPDRLQQIVVAAFDDFGDLGLRFDRGPEVKLTPLPTISLGGVTLFDRTDGHALAKIDSIEGRPGFLAALVGETTLTEITLHSPKLEIVVEADGRSNWDRAFRRTAERVSTGRVLPHLIIFGGDLAYSNKRSGERLTLEDVDLGIDWPHFASPFTLRGSVSKDSETLRFDVRLSDFGTMLRGGESRASLSAQLPSMNLQLDGQFLGGPNPQIKGVLKLDSAQLKTALRWFGHDFGARDDVLNRFALKGDATVASGRIVVENARVDLDSNLASGALFLQREGNKLAVRGTLDAGNLNLTPYFSGLSVNQDSSGGWNSARIDMVMAPMLDLDLRLSAAALTIGSLSLGNVGASVTSRAGKLNLTLGESNAYGGSLRGALSFVPEDNGLRMDVSVNAQRIDLARSFSDWFGLTRLEGTGNVRANLKATGTTMQGFVQNMQGEVSLMAIDGAVTGVNAEAVLRRLERRPLAPGQAEDRRGRTPFARASGSLTIADGFARTGDIAMDGPNLTISMAGAVHLPVREFDLKGVAHLKKTDDNSGTFDLPFLVQGPWNDPYVLPDPDARILRSQAAAPLRNRLRDQEAIRAVMDVVRQHGLDVLEGSADADRPAAPGAMPPLTLPLLGLPQR